MLSRLDAFQEYMHNTRAYNEFDSDEEAKENQKFMEQFWENNDPLEYSSESNGENANVDVDDLKQIEDEEEESKRQWYADYYGVSNNFFKQTSTNSSMSYQQKHLQNQRQLRSIKRQGMQNAGFKNKSVTIRAPVKKLLKLPKTLERELLANPALEQLRAFQKKFIINRKILSYFLLGFLQKYHEDQSIKNIKLHKDTSGMQEDWEKSGGDLNLYLEYQKDRKNKHDSTNYESLLFHFKSFTLQTKGPGVTSSGIKVDPHFKKESFAKMSCVIGREMNDILLYLIETYHVDLRVDDDAMLELCASNNNITGFELIFNMILTNKQQIDHTKLGSILLYCASEGYFKILKTLFTYETFLGYVQLYLKKAIQYSIENQHYDIFDYLCDYLMKNVNELEIKYNAINRAFITCCILDEKNVFKYLIYLIDPDTNFQPFEINLDTLMKCIETKSIKIARLLINTLLRSYNSKSIRRACELVIMECIKHNVTKLIPRINGILTTHDKEPRWNKIIKELFENKFLETVNVKSFEYILEIISWDDFKSQHDFDMYCDYFLVHKIKYPKIIHSFVKFLYEKNIPIAINYDNIGTYLAICLRDSNLTGILFVCYVLIQFYCTNVDGTIDENLLRTINHDILPPDFDGVFNDLLQDPDLFKVIIKLLGVKYFLKNDMFYERLKVSVEIVDDLHLKIVDICQDNNIDLCLESKNYQFFRIICEQRKEESLATCLEIYDRLGTIIDYNNIKVSTMMKKMVTVDPLIAYRIKSSNNYITHLKNTRKVNYDQYGRYIDNNVNNNNFTGGTILGNLKHNPNNSNHQTRIIPLFNSCSSGSDSESRSGSETNSDSETNQEFNSDSSTISQFSFDDDTDTSYDTEGNESDDNYDQEVIFEPVEKIYTEQAKKNNIEQVKIIRTYDSVKSNNNMERHNFNEYTCDADDFSPPSSLNNRHISSSRSSSSFLEAYEEKESTKYQIINDQGEIEYIDFDKY